MTTTVNAGPPPAATDTPPAGSLWRNPHFLRLWVGQSISDFGSQVTQLALPLTAVFALAATPQELGVLGATGFGPVVVLTLFAGAWVDRRRKRGLMIASSLARAALIGLIPLLNLLGALHIEHLYLVALLAGAFGVVFDVCYQSYLPSLVTQAQLVEGNSKLQATFSIARMSGPGIGGLLVGIMTAPFALVVDAVSFLVSAGSLVLIRKPEAAPVAPSQRRRVLAEIQQGLRFVFTNTYLRMFAVQAFLWNLFTSALQTITIIYGTQQLHLSAGEMGLTFGGAATGSLVASIVARRVGTRFGIGPSICAAVVTACGATILIPLAGGPKVLIMLVMGLSYFLSGFGATTSNIHVVSLRQTITPGELLGRVGASHRFVAGSALALGALAGGFIAGPVGIRPVLFAGSFALIVSAVMVLLSPVRRLRTAQSAA